MGLEATMRGTRAAAVTPYPRRWASPSAYARATNGSLARRLYALGQEMLAFSAEAGVDPEAPMPERSVSVQEQIEAVSTILNERGAPIEALEAILNGDAAMVEWWGRKLDRIAAMASGRRS